MITDSSRLRLDSDRDFSLVLGGPLFQLLVKARLSDGGLTLLHQRIVVIGAVAWVPLLVLALFQGQALRGAIVPFLFDVDVHVRFLVSMPLLIAAELIVHRRMRTVAQTFLDRHLIPEPALPQFEEILASSMRWRNSVIAEIVIIAVVYGLGILVVWRHYTALEASTWYASASSGGLVPSPAGLWYGYVSLPIFQFLLVRWYFRIGIWIRFLWKVSRIELRLVPTHPDRVGGLGFLAGTSYALSLIAAAHGALLAGQLSNRILFLGARLTEYKAQIGVTVLFLLVLILSPLMVFAGQLSRAKHKGLREYGTLAERYVREFDAKWLKGHAPPDEPFVGSADIQSLADLGNSFEVVRSMRFTPVTKEAVLQLVILTLLPITPLLLTMMPLEELLKTLLGVLF